MPCSFFARHSYVPAWSGRVLLISSQVVTWYFNGPLRIWKFGFVGDVASENHFSKAIHKQTDRCKVVENSTLKTRLEKIFYIDEAINMRSPTSAIIAQSFLHFFARFSDCRKFVDYAKPCTKDGRRKPKKHFASRVYFNLKSVKYFLPCLYAQKWCKQQCRTPGTKLHVLEIKWSEWNTWTAMPWLSPGLKTFSPSLSHSNQASGKPDTEQLNTAVLPVSAVWFIGGISTRGAAEQRQQNYCLKYSCLSVVQTTPDRNFTQG